MVFAELESHVLKSGLSIQDHPLNGETWMIIKGIRLNAGPHEGTVCEVAVRRSEQIPWAPDAQIHVRPALTPMGQKSSHPSPLGTDWQYLSRQLSSVPSPSGYLAYVYSALEEL